MEVLNAAENERAKQVHLNDAEQIGPNEPNMECVCVCVRVMQHLGIADMNANEHIVFETHSSPLP